MSWLVRDDEEDPITTLRNMINEDGIFQVPGTHDAMAGLLAKKAGFRVIYLSGGAFSASMGMPDVGLFTLTELATRTREITRATGMPILVDIDNGSNSILNLSRIIKEIIDAGAAAVQVEDQKLPKKCGHLNGKRLVTKKEMIQKIQAIRNTSDKIIIVARVDAKSVEGMNSAIERAKAYVKAGADVIFPEALETEDEFKRFAQEIDKPLLANMTEYGRTPYYHIDQFKEWGYKMVIYPVTSLRVASKAIENVYNSIRDEGSQKNTLDQMQTRKDLYETIKYYDYEKLDNNIAKTVLQDMKN
ncbi:methylisocitrate lyase [Aquibacillus saliphilus]|uniref:methylisocitrate lyase n=1 Tax=Aquibacillus saliphilus TaxID=1909422 RepID=UPI001CEFE487|nr:methylisocitrate lyase [Aquibacillus saliphilus]